MTCWKPTMPKFVLRRDATRYRDATNQSKIVSFASLSDESSHSHSKVCTSKLLIEFRIVDYISLSPADRHTRAGSKTAESGLSSPHIHVRHKTRYLHDCDHFLFLHHHSTLPLHIIFHMLLWKMSVLLVECRFQKKPGKTIEWQLALVTLIKTCKF